MKVRKTGNCYAVHIGGFIIIFTRFEKVVDEKGVNKNIVSFYFYDSYKCDLYEPDAFYKAWREMKCLEAKNETGI